MNRQIAFFKRDGSISVADNPTDDYILWDSFYIDFAEQLHDVHSVRFNMGRHSMQYIMYTDGKLVKW